ncbi:hypothetical protein niasHT_024117 [Heterodera trifolii]|uniref:Glutathione synthetase n=1 Tax=Heterodera trifolii TaxID=157864 RepID=A0ABD2KQR4_9BILA
MAAFLNGNAHSSIECNGVVHAKNGIDQNGTKLADRLQHSVQIGTKKASVSRGSINVNKYVLEVISDTDQLHTLEQYAIDYAHSIGLVAPLSDPPEGKFTNIYAVPPPIALLPSPFPRELYDHAVNVQQAMNELYFRVASDHDFLMDAFKDVVKGDPFMARFVQIAQMVHDEGIHQPLAVQLQRSDYMAHWDPSDGSMALKQVEVNIGPIGGPGFAFGVSKLHQKMLDKVAIEHDGKPAILANSEAPLNRSRQNIAYTLYQSWKLFGDPKAVLLFLDTPNITHFEQLQFIQFEVEKLGKQQGNFVKVLVLSLTEASKRISLDESGDFSLYLDGTKRVALVHIADGNVPHEYPTEHEWTARTTIERSNAILSPNIRFHLSSTKKIQQVLAKPGMVERFFPNDPKRVALIRSTFTGLWGLEVEDEATREVIEDAIRSPGNYVLKSQMEAGLGNFFDDEMAQMLQQMSTEERGAYILQQRIKPLVVKNYLMREAKPAELEDVVSEMGIYGSLIGDQSNGRILHNAFDGHTIRSKRSDLNLGGVCCGGGAIDSPLLFPMAQMLDQSNGH